MNPVLEKVYQIGIIPVIAFNSVDEAVPLCKALVAGGLSMMVPGSLTDVIGLAVVAAVVVLQRLAAKREAAR